jgi:hypothetical protein
MSKILVILWSYLAQDRVHETGKFIWQLSNYSVTKKISVGFGVLTVVVMKNSIFWDITRLSPLKVNRPFGGTCRLQLQVRRISQARWEYESGAKQSSIDFQTTLCYVPEDRNLQGRLFSEDLVTDCERRT